MSLYKYCTVLLISIVAPTHAGANQQPTHEPCRAVVSTQPHQSAIVAFLKSHDMPTRWSHETAQEFSALLPALQMDWGSPRLDSRFAGAGVYVRQNSEGKPADVVKLLPRPQMVATEVQVAEWLREFQFEQFSVAWVQGAYSIRLPNGQVTPGIAMDFVEGKRLGDLELSELPRALQAAARALAEIHMRLPPGTREQFPNEIRDLLTSAQSLASRSAEQISEKYMSVAEGNAFRHRVQGLTHQMMHDPEFDFSLTHADAHALNLLWNDRGLVLIDIGGMIYSLAEKDEKKYGIGNAARDTARLVASLEVLGLQKQWPLSEVQRLQQTFLQAYSKERRRTIPWLISRMKFHYMYYLMLNVTDRAGRLEESEHLRVLARLKEFLKNPDSQLKGL